MKISQKLIFGFVGIASLVIVVGYFSVNTSRKTLQKTIGNASALLATKMLENIDTSICSRIEFIQSTTKDLITQRVVSESNKEFEKINDIQAYISKKDRQWMSEPKEVKTVFMQDLINNQLSEELREKAIFYHEKYGYAIFGEIFVTNKYGANVAQTGKTTDYYQADEQWWQNAREDSIYVDNVKYDESSGIYSTDICVRIDDINDNFAGVIKAILNIEETISFIKRTAAQETDGIDFKLLSKDGKLLYATQKNEVSITLPKELLACFNKDKGLGRKAGFVIAADTDQKAKVFAYAYSNGYKDYKGLDWILVVEHKTEQIFAPITDLKKQILTASIAITLLAISIGLLISRSISRPLGRLSIAAARIGQGRLDSRLEINSNDEIGQLSILIASEPAPSMFTTINCASFPI